MTDLLILEHWSFILLDTSKDTSDVSKITVGENWVRQFINRRDELISKYSRKYNYQHTRYEDPTVILVWFEQVQKRIEEYGILEDDIYNIDKTGFQMGVASTAKVVTRSDRRSRPVVIQPSNHE